MSLFSVCSPFISRRLVGIPLQSTSHVEYRRAFNLSREGALDPFLLHSENVFISLVLGANQNKWREILQTIPKFSFGKRQRLRISSADKVLVSNNSHVMIDGVGIWLEGCSQGRAPDVRWATISGVLEVQNPCPFPQKSKVTPFLEKMQYFFWK